MKVLTLLTFIFGHVEFLRNYLEGKSHNSSSRCFAILNPTTESMREARLRVIGRG